MVPEKEQVVKVKNVGGVHEASFVLKPGVNVLRGRNGSGKTSVMRALARAYGAKVPLEVRDGAGSGTIEIPGATVKVKSVVRSSGEAELELADVGPLATLIDPGIDDPERSAAARMRAFAELRPFPATVEAILELAGDDEVGQSIAQEHKEGGCPDLLSAAERCRITGHRLAREAEARAQRMEGSVGAAQQRVTECLEKLGGESALVETTAAEAEAIGHQLVSRLEAARLGARQRAELEARQAAARKAVGNAPDPSRFDQDIEAREGAIAAHEKRIAELTAQIAKERELMAGVVADLKSLRSGRSDEAARLLQHQEAMRVLALPVEGPTAAEVEAIEVELEQHKGRFRAARLSDDVRAAREAAEAAVAEQKTCAKRAEDLRVAATTISERFGDLLNAQGIKGWTVTDGRLANIVEGEVYDFATRRSEGQRIAAAFELAADSFRGRVLPFDPRYWTALDAEHQALAARTAVKLGLYLLTEEPAAGELRCDHETGVERSAA